MKTLISFICFVTSFSQVLCSNPLTWEKRTEASSPLQEAIPPSIVKDILDNSQCEDGMIMWREQEKNTIKGLVIHYTVSQTYDLTKRAYYRKGVSAHYTVDYNGVIYANVPDRSIAFHAGISAFDGDIFLNRCFIGIEQVHPGYIEKGVEYKGVWDDSKLLRNWPGNSAIKWFKFFEKQYEATGALVRQLQLKFGVHGRFVVTHADIAPGRKFDAGPMFPYRLIFEKFKAGYYPSFDKIEKYVPLLSSLTYEDYVGLLGVYGYDFSLPTHYLEDYKKKMTVYESEKEAYEKGKERKSELQEPIRLPVPNQEGYEKFVLGSFRLHFCSDLAILDKLSQFGKVLELHSEELSDLEKMVILSLSIGYYHYKDEDLGYEESFRTKLEAFACESVRKDRMEQFISLLK